MVPNKEIVLHHHLGLGDHFVCNGLVHEATKYYSKVYLPAKLHNFKTVECLYKDWDNIIVFSVEDEYKDIQAYCSRHDLPILKVGFEYLNGCQECPSKCFYNQLGLSYSVRYDNFKLPPPTLDSQALYNQLVGTIGEYALIHQQSSVGTFVIKRESNLPVVEIKSGLTNNLLDYIKIIENAVEIHCIDSSVINLIEGMSVKTNKLFFHPIKKTASFEYSDKWKRVKY